jgi:hypothetical protein
MMAGTPEPGQVSCDAYIPGGWDIQADFMLAWGLHQQRSQSCYDWFQCLEHGECCGGQSSANAAGHRGVYAANANAHQLQGVPALHKEADAAASGVYDFTTKQTFLIGGGCGATAPTADDDHTADDDDHTADDDFFTLATISSHSAQGDAHWIIFPPEQCPPPTCGLWACHQPVGETTPPKVISRPICAHAPVLVPFAKCHWLRVVASTLCTAVPEDSRSDCISDLGVTCDLSALDWYSAAGEAEAFDASVAPAVGASALSNTPSFPAAPHTCGRASAAAWASFASYSGNVFGLNGVAWDYFAALQAAGWWQGKHFKVPAQYDTDEVRIFVRGSRPAVGTTPAPRNCMVAFRGADSAKDVASPGGASSPVPYANVSGISPLVANEAIPLFARMKADGAAVFIGAHCAHVSAVGYGLGGAMAELFAAVANRNGDPAGLGIQVDSVFTFGALPVATAALTNDLPGSGGCFPGARHVLVSAGGGEEDPAVSVSAGYVHPSMRTVTMAGGSASAGGQHAEYACGSAVPARVAGSLAVLHVASAYSNFLGCSVDPVPTPTAAPTIDVHFVSA